MCLAYIFSVPGSILHFRVCNDTIFLMQENIISLNRGDDWIFNIDKDTVLKAGDEIVAVGNQGSENLLKKFADGKIKGI